MPRWLLYTVPALVATGVALRLTVLAPEVVPVRVVAVQAGGVETTVSNTKAGTLRARRRAKMSPENAGLVVEVAVAEGEQVQAGQTLLRLSDATQQAQLVLAQESLRASQAALLEACLTRDRARREFTRKRQIAQQGVLSADALDRLETAYQVGEASCNAAGAQSKRAAAQVVVAEAELGKRVLRAPFAGIVAEIDVEMGEWITPSPPLMVAPPVADLIDPTSLYVSAPMDEVDSGRIRKGQRARVTLDSQPGLDFEARVVRVAPYVLDVEAQNRTVEIEVELDDRELSSRLLPGTSADVEVILEVRDRVLRIPAPALLAGNRVLVVQDGRLEERAVEVGLENWDYAEVRGGLEAGQLVVVSLESADVKAGARVEVEETSYQP
jgi:HlyD family secretion protein